jgi:predicted permease
MKPTFRGPTGDGFEREARRDVDEELALHLEAMEEALTAEGMGAEEARAEARRRFGDVDATARYCAEQQVRRQRTGGMRRMMDELRHDAKTAFRSLTRSPGYATVVILTLAIGIAANTVIFSILNPYFLRPLPFDEADRLVQLGQVDPSYNWDGARFSLKMLEDYESRSEAFEGLAAYHYGQANVTGEQGATRIMVGYQTGDMFELLGSDPVMGRTFGSGEDGPGAPSVVVLGQGIWERRWGSDPGILGRSVELNGTPYTVIGVMGSDFSFPFGEVQAWLPMPVDAAEEDRDRNGHLVVGRLRDGWTTERARAELEGIQASLAETYPDVDGVYTGISVKPIREALNFVWNELRLAMSIVLAAVFAVLAIACVNVASLTLARAHRKSRDVAVRAALGAGRRRLIRNLVVESALLAAVGGLLGVGAAYAVTAALNPLIPDGIFKVGGVTVDGTVLAFSAAVTLVTPLIFGLAPALRIARSDVMSLLRSARGTGSTGGLAGRRRLVVAEIALAIVLVTGTGLMIRSVMELESTDLGYDARSMLTVEANPPEAEYTTSAEYGDYFRRASEELAALPGVEVVGQVYPLPMNHETFPAQFARPGLEPAEGESWPTAVIAWASPSYFSAAGISLLAGRTFDASDRDGDPTVVISRKVAMSHFDGIDPVGATLLVGESRTPMTVVGVVEDVYHSGFDATHGAEGADASIYRSLEQSPRRRRFLVARAAAAPASLTGSAREVMRGVDANLSVAVRPMMDVVRENTFQWTLSSAFLGIFGVVAVFLASLGIYGLVSYSVAQRRQELGVRMALGAERGSIRALVLGDGARLAVTGGLIGLAGALLLGNVAGAFLYRVDPWDPATLGSVLALFTVVVLTAAFVPAVKATRVDPVQVLREE